MLYAGGDHKEELGLEEGAKKGGRKEGTGVVGLESAAKFAATLARYMEFEEEEREMGCC